MSLFMRVAVKDNVHNVVYEIYLHFLREGSYFSGQKGNTTISSKTELLWK